MTSHPNLDERIQERRGRRKRAAIGFVAIVALIAVIIAVVWRLAGSWGVPGFSFTNEYGSTCKNNLTGYVCSPMSEEHVRAVVDAELPEGMEMVASAYTKKGPWSMTARFLMPEEVAKDAIPKLRETYGDCAPSAPSSLKTEPGLTDFCVMTDARAPEGAPRDNRWTITTARDEAGDTVLQIDMSQG